MRVLYVVGLLLGMTAFSAMGADGDSPALDSSVSWSTIPSLLRRASVQKELGLTPEQLAKLDEVTRQTDKDMTKLRQEGRDKPARESSKAMDERVRERDQGYAAILKPGQIKRLNQIALQAVSYRALRSRSIQESLALSDEQKKKAHAIAKAVGDNTPKPSSGLTLDEITKKHRELAQSALEQFLAILTGEQKQKWKEMTGKPFDFKRDTGNLHGVGERPRPSPDRE